MLPTLATVRRGRYIVSSNPPGVPADSKPKSLRCHERCVFFLTRSAAVPVSCCIPPLNSDNNPTSRDRLPSKAVVYSDSDGDHARTRDNWGRPNETVHLEELDNGNSTGPASS